MIEKFAQEFRVTTRKACERYAQELNTAVGNVQLRFRMWNDNIVYSKMLDYRRVEDVTFLNILGVKIDFKGRSFATPPLISRGLYTFAEKFGVAVEKVFVFAIPNSNAKDGLSMWLYLETEPVREFQIEELFGVEAEEEDGQTIEMFAERIMKNEDLSGDNDVEYYQNNSEAIEKALQQMRSATT